MTVQYLVYLIRHKIFKHNRLFWYVGSTDNFNKRIGEHKHRYENVNNKEYNKKVYQKIRACGDWDYFEFIILEVCDNTIICERDAAKREQYYMDKLKTDLNDRKAFSTDRDNKENNKNRSKKYREKNKEKIKERKAEAYQQNKEKIKEKSKEYREKNKEEISAKASQKIICECGCIIRRSDISIHKKSKKHQKRIESLNEAKIEQN